MPSHSYFMAHSSLGSDPGGIDIPIRPGPGTYDQQQMSLEGFSFASAESLRRSPF
jgi:hypothetical protein